MIFGEEHEIHRAIADAQSDHAVRDALCDAAGTWSHAEVFQTALRLSSILADNGVRRGDVVVVVSERCATFVICLLGVLMAGGRFLVVDRDQVNDHTLDVLERLSPAHWLFIDGAAQRAGSLHDRLEERLQGHLTRLPLGKQALIDVLAAAVHGQTDGGCEAVPVEVGGAAPAYLIWTSGTTAAPKLISTLHRSVVNFLDWYVDEFRIDCTDRFALLSGLAHDPVIRDVFTPLTVGASLQIPTEAQRMSAEMLAAWLRQAQPTILHLTPPMLELLGSGRSAVGPATSVRLLASGGARLTHRHVSIAREIFPRAEVVNFYGASETPQAMGFHRIGPGGAGEAERHSVPIGKGIRGAQLLVLTPDKTPCRPRERGEIFVRSRYLSEGYLGLPVPTGLQFMPNPLGEDPADRVFATRDLGMYDFDGTVHWLGRVDRQVKIGANRVSPDDLEVELAQLAGIQQAAVLFDEPTNRLLVYIVPRADTSGSEALVRSHLASTGPFPIVPARVYMLDALPLTANGKTDYSRLRTFAPSVAAPQTGLEVGAVQEAVRRIWASELCCTTFSSSDTFLELGGNSFVAIRIAGLLSERLRTPIRVVDLFTHPTLDSLTRFLSARESHGGVKEQLEQRMMQRRKAIARADRKGGA